MGKREINFSHRGNVCLTIVRERMRASRSGVTPFAQAPDVYNGDWKSILRVFQLGRKESVECYCTEKHVSKHGVTFDWLLHTHGWHVKDKWHVKVKIPSRSRARLTCDQAPLPLPPTKKIEASPIFCCWGGGGGGPDRRLEPDKLTKRKARNPHIWAVCAAL